MADFRVLFSAFEVPLWSSNEGSNFLDLKATTTIASPTNIFEPASTPAHSIFGLSVFVLAIVGLIFVVVARLLVYALTSVSVRLITAMSQLTFTEALRLSSPGSSSQFSLWSF